MKTMNCPVTKFIDSKMQRFDPLWQAQNGVGGLRSRYYDKTGVAKYREWRGLHDTMVDYRAWLKNVMSMAAMVASAPIPCLKGFWEYRWMGSYLGTFMFIDRLFEGYRGPELVIAHMNMHAIVQSLTKKIALVLSHDLRIGGKDAQTFVNPRHICQYNGDLYVACGGNKIRKIDGMDYTVSDYRTFSQQVKRYHKFGQYALVVLESGTYLVDESKE